MKESDLQAQVADYLRLQYPDVLFHSDFGSGVRLTPSQAVKQKRQNGGRRAWPDMFIAEVRIIIPRDFDEVNQYAQNHWVCFPHKKGGCIKPAMVVMAGLFLELKKEGIRLKKKNGEWATSHIAEQAKVLERLRDRGYCAEFAIGFDEAKRIIDEYVRRQDKSMANDKT